MNNLADDRDRQFRLQRFWGSVIFSFGILWGFANFTYSPVAAVTSIVGSSWYEVFVITAGGVLAFCASIGAFYGRRTASRTLLLGGIVILLLAIGGQMLLRRHAHGPANLLLLYLSGPVAMSLGIFGYITERKGWPPLLASSQ